MTRRRTYGQPPLIEALCQFRFRPGQEWDLAIPGLLYQLIQDQFPIRRQQKALELFLHQESGGVEKRPFDRMQFLNKDENALVQVGPDLLIVNVLRPYPGWDVFRALIVDALKSYHEVAKPAGLQLAALRYINKVDLPAPSVQIEEYSRFHPNIPGPIPQTFVSWAQSVDVPFESGLMRISAASNEPSKEFAFILDLEYVTIEAVLLDIESGVLSWIDEGHKNIEQTFEACLTDKARSLFEETTDEQTSVG